MEKNIAYKKQKYFILTGEHVLKVTSLNNINSANIRISIPVSNNNQVPIVFKIDGEFLNYEFLSEKNVENQTIKINFPSMIKNEEKTIKIFYQILVKKQVLKKINQEVSIPTNNDLPNSVKRWLNHSKSIQSNNIFIKATSYFFRGFSKNMIWYIKKIVCWIPFHGIIVNYFKRYSARHKIIRKILHSNKYWMQLEDALSCLFFGSTCTGQANLQAALLRAQGIPSRVCIATSMFYGKNRWLDAQHYIIEFFHPKNGWIQAQSGRIGSSTRGDIVLRIVTPEDEDIAGNGFDEYGGMPTWFWKSDDLMFLVPNNFKTYNISKKENIGFPIVRGWNECTIMIPDEKIHKIFTASQKAWKYYINNLDHENKEFVKKSISLQKKSLSYLCESNFEKFLETIKKIRISF